MRARIRGGYAVLFIAMLWCLSSSVMGAEQSIIKVGLESVYKNAQSITLTSDAPIGIGYYDTYGFTQIGTLDSQTVSISKASDGYYDEGSLYYSYQAAVEAARNNGGIPVYVDQGLFAVYSTGLAESNVTSSTSRYVVKNALGEAILVFNKGSVDLVFRGYDSATGLYLTGVGSSKKYRGAIGIGGTSGITPYNILNIEEYLYGVVPGEMSPSWPEEALKAQAVAARSIAIYQYNRYTSYGYNVVDTTATQVYGGYTKEDSRTTAAVDATKGETIKYNGVVAEALYFSTSGGYTESAVNVWGNQIGYLVGVSDQYETEPAQAEWTRSITLEDLNRCLASQGVNIGTAQGVQIVSRTASGRVQEMRILGSSGNYSLTLEKIRTFFSGTSGGSLKSRLFSFSGSTIADNGNTNNNGSTSNTGTVVVASANGTAQVALGDGNSFMTNGQVTMMTNQVAAMQSATDMTMTAINGLVADNTTVSNSIGQTETVWGDFTIYGKGFGHGVGMSQSGAKGMAKAGYQYDEILKHYYTGVTVG